MSDATETPTTPTIAVEQTPTAPSTSGADLSALQAQLAALTAERDGLAEQVKTLTPLSGERDKLAAELSAIAGERDKLQVDLKKHVEREREGAVLDRLYGALPHAEKGLVRAKFRDLAAEGKCERYPEKADDTAKAVLEVLKAESSTLLLPRIASAGHNHGLKPASQAQRVSSTMGRAS